MRKETIGQATLYLGDCVTFMRGLGDGEFDVAIVDPPYAVGASDGSFGRGGARSQIKEYRKDLGHYANHNEPPSADYFEHLFRVSKHQIIWGANYYPQFLRHSGWVVWDKEKKDGLLSQAELAFQSFDKVVKIFRHEWEGFRKGAGSFEATADRIIHPNQKPVRLYEWLLTTYCTGHKRILDTHCGSASIAVATNKLSFDLTACELHEPYYEAACQRVSDAQRQEQLFA